MRKLNFTYIVTSLENEEINTIYKNCSRPYIRGLATKRQVEFMFQKKIMEQFPEIAFDICTNVEFKKGDKNENK
ncbi:hypothetical protein ITQ94_08930 [Pediococcus pentosaceus]|uniref:hypothetical protein n=1 Tax=Pediococcus pentosaceus TaxID=1255 RepID=UPI0018FEA22F|nr:hypothetical protein [Pediococcus pentosaceus]MBF7131559.1 hypothetical protein [Pediococcus pentosaceus]